MARTKKNELTTLSESIAPSELDSPPYPPPLEDKIEPFDRIIGPFNSKGLRSGVQYHFHDDGFVNWFASIDKSDMVPFKENFERRNEVVPRFVDGLDPKDCLILLNGFKKLARLRGYSSVFFDTIVSSPEYVDVTCTIRWLPNFETGGHEVSFASKGSAQLNNCDSFTKYYLSSMAENRAFVRAVRGFLNIPSYGKDEIGLTPGEESSNKGLDTKKLTPHALLEEELKSKGATFERLKIKLGKEGIGNPDQYNCIADIPLPIVLDLIGRMSR